MNAKGKTMSKLRGKPGTHIRKRVKAFFYGEAGSGKTTCAINFPKPYYIDTEKGSEHSQYIKILEQKGGMVYQTRDFQDLFQEVRTLATEKHSFETLVIDPITPIYANLVEACSKKVGIAHGRHYGEANKEFERLLDLLLRIDMNVVITAHGKKEYGSDMAVIGNTFDAYKKLPFIFDLVIESKIVGKEHKGVIKKSRISTIPANEEIPFNYESIQNLYGQDILEGESVPILETVPNKVRSFAQLQSEDDGYQLQREIKYAVEYYSVPWEMQEKWITAANVSSLDELSDHQIRKLLEMLNKKYNSQEEVQSA
jgi:hypothetical protein